MSNLAELYCPNLLELLATCCAIEVVCLLDSHATHSFVHPCVECSTSVAISKGAEFTIMVANGNQVVCDVVIETGLVFMAR